MRDDARFPRYDGGSRHDDELAVEDLTTRELVRELVEHAKLLAREEAELAREGVSEGRVRLAGDVALAKHEIGEEVGKAKRAGTSVGVGAVLCHDGVEADGLRLVLSHADLSRARRLVGCL